MSRVETYLHMGASAAQVSIFIFVVCLLIELSLAVSTLITVIVFAGLFRWFVRDLRYIGIMRNK
jgi:hypothetical protein